MGKSAPADKSGAHVLQPARPLSSHRFRPVRLGLVLMGVLFLAQGGGKALDPTGYMAALDAFHVLRPAMLAPVSLGALALVWTVLELLAGVAMLYGGLARTPAHPLVLAGLMVALGLSCAYLSLDAGAYVRHLPIANCTVFGSFLPQRLSWLVLPQEDVRDSAAHGG